MDPFFFVPVPFRVTHGGCLVTGHCLASWNSRVLLISSLKGHHTFTTSKEFFFGDAMLYRLIHQLTGEKN